MADFTSTGWVAGETVTPYDATGASVGAKVASSSGSAAFTDLDSGAHTAVGSTSGRRIRFTVAAPQVKRIVVLTQADYDVLSSPDDSTLYVVSG